MSNSGPFWLDDLFRAWRGSGVGASGGRPAALLIPENYHWPPMVDTLPKLTSPERATLWGIPVVRSALLPLVPAVKIDPKFPWITDAGRERINARLLEQFGEVEAVFVFSAEAVRAMQEDVGRRVGELMRDAFYGGWE